MNTLTRRIATLVSTIALAATATGCANTPTATPTADTADSQADLDALNNASEITATKSLFSWVPPAVESCWFLHRYCVTISTTLVSEREDLGGDSTRWVLTRL